MNFMAEIELAPSFHDGHVWQVSLCGRDGVVKATCGDDSGLWRMTSAETDEAPEAVRLGAFSAEPLEERGGLDGITVSFHINTNGTTIDQAIWCPDEDFTPDYEAMIRWCWRGLYEHSTMPYRIRLEQLYSYFDWGNPVVRTDSGVRIFGGLAVGHEDELEQVLQSTATIPRPEIDMRNSEGMGTLLYPIFVRFAEKVPSALFVVNEVAHRQLTAAGIASVRMELATDG